VRRALEAIDTPADPGGSQGVARAAEEGADVPDRHRRWARAAGRAGHRRAAVRPAPAAAPGDHCGSSSGGGTRLDASL
jgi:hypothetical protein